MLLFRDSGGIVELEVFEREGTLLRGLSIPGFCDIDLGEWIFLQDGVTLTSGETESS